MNGIGRGDDDQKKKKASVITRETVGMTLLLFSAVLFLIAVTGKYVFGDVGLAITSFFVGLFGFAVYPLLVLVFYLSLCLTFGKKLLPARWLVRGSLLVLAVFLIVHLATSERFAGAGYGAYLAGCWDAATESIAQGTGGGVLLGIVVYPVQALFRPAGAYVVFALLVALVLFWMFTATPLWAQIRGRKPQEGRAKEDRARGQEPAPVQEASAPAEIPVSAVHSEGTRAYPVMRTFDDLPAPEARAIPEEGRRTAASPVRTSRVSPRAGNADYEHSRSVLFEMDPAESYSANRIFDRDSIFNTTPRRSSVERSEGSRATGDALTDSRYSDAWERSALDGRTTLPRRVTGSERQEEGGYRYPVDDFNYPQTPSYRVSTEREEQPARDFYARDVQPTPEPQPVKEEPPVRDFYARDVQPTDIPAPQPVKEELPAPQPVKEEPPAPQPVKEEPPARSAESGFRSLFSRPGRNFDESKATPVRPTRAFEEEPPAPTRPTRAFEEDVFQSDAGTVGESRVFDAPMPERSRSNAGLFDDVLDEGNFMEEPEQPAQTERTRSFSERIFRRGEQAQERSFRREEEAPALPEPKEPAPVPEKHVYKAYVRPSASRFRDYDDKVVIPPEEVEQNSRIIVDTLAGFRVEASVVKVTSGSAVTRYDIDIPRNITVRAVVKHDEEIAMRLHARDGVNIYSNSEVGAISIEVPNSVRATVGLKSVLQAEEYVNAKPTALMFAIGKDVEGRNVCGNIVKMKHILVAGATGSGKSVCLNAMLVSLICKYSPEDLRLILIDPKKVEFAVYDGLPHLMINEIIADAQKAVSALNWAIKEMERRYQLFEQKTRNGKLVHNLDEYNANLIDGEEKLPKIVIVVDELADLMSVAKKDVEERIQRLAQKARAAGMHLVIATQRPSVDVITGVIKGNLPTRIAFRVIQEVDSRTIIDTSGAEKLLGNGDLLYRTEGMFGCSRVQGAFLNSEEVQSVIEDIKANNEAYFDQSVADYINKTSAEGGEGGAAGGDPDDDSVDPQYIQALAIVVKLGQASISLIQRKCSVGYNHAGKIIEWMELMGYISPFDGKAKARAVLLTKEEYEAKYGSLD